jgi:hypothetical protein
MTAIVTPILEPPHAKQVILAMAGPSDETAPSIRAFAREVGIPVERVRRCWRSSSRALLPTARPG